ncbi:MAG: T9SS type A sorting domain-containing protein [Bacteroidales bacterium]|nr:T9SS type A sorting domain-containing protein [Bacteroidales bacterium]
MKKGIIITILLATIVTAYCQTDTITPCQRYNLYLYDSLWADNFSQHCQGSCDIRGSKWETVEGSPAIVLRKCHTDTALRIAGIAAPIWIDSTSAAYNSPNRLPEYFYLYAKTDTGFTLLGSARWDNNEPTKLMQFFGIKGRGFRTPNTRANGDPYGNLISDYPVFEAYFDKPITVTDTFYVGGSTFNNYNVGQIMAFPRTRYIRWKYTYSLHNDICMQYIPNPTTTDLIMYTGTEGSNIQDTCFLSNHLLDKGFGCIFPIIDTSNNSIVPQNDTCLGSTGLRILDISGRNVTITWNEDGSANNWELAIVKGDTVTAAPQNGIINSYSGNWIQIYYLDSAWYSIFLRTVCNADNGLYSEWSEAVRFQIPIPDTTNTGFETSLAEYYTTVSPNPTNGVIDIFSSFKIKQISVITSTGSPVFEGICNSHHEKIDIKDYPSGTYFVRIHTTEGIVTKKIVKR